MKQVKSRQFHLATIVAIIVCRYIDAVDMIQPSIFLQPRYFSASKSLRTVLCSASSTLSLSLSLSRTLLSQALRLSNRARRSRTVGEIVNLMSVDAQRIMDFMPYAHSLWSSVFQIIGSLLLLYQTVGWSVVAGVSVMVLLIPINMAMASLSKKYQVS